MADDIITFMQQTERLQYSKNLDGWNNFKKKLDNRGEIPMFKERDIWWTAIGHNIGVEENGKGDEFKRPVLIIKKFNSLMFWGVPMTTVEKSGQYYYKLEHVNDKGVRRTSYLMLSHLRTYDSRRLMQKYGMVDENSFKKIKAKVCDLLS